MCIKQVIGIASKEKKVYSVKWTSNLILGMDIDFLLNRCYLKSVSFGTKTNECDESELNVHHI